jgi:hypothetical protein
MKASPSNKLSLVCALSWIVGSTIIITGSAHIYFTQYLFARGKIIKNQDLYVNSLIQTGPQKEPLRSEYLAQLMGLSLDKPVRVTEFDAKKAQRDVLESPLVQEARVKVIKPSTVYIDYTVRQPIAWLYDFENLAISKDGCVIPMHPFFPPKNLPEIYMGLSPFGQEGLGLQTPQVQWNKPLLGPYFETSIDLLTRLQPLARDLFRVLRIDVSRMFESSLGRREIVIILQNELFLSNREDPVLIKHFLRLSTKNYPQEIGNYIELRKKILEDDYAFLDNDPLSNQSFNLDKVIDLRLKQLAYIDQPKTIQ